MERSPPEWESETFTVGGLGPVTATGTRDLGVVTSVRSACCIRPGRRVEVSAECRFPPDGAPEIEVLAAGAPFGAGRLSDDEVATVRALLLEALAEWCATPEAQAMIARNSSITPVAGPSATEADAMVAEAEALLAQEPEGASERFAIVAMLAEAQAMRARSRRAAASDEV